MSPSATVPRVAARGIGMSALRALTLGRGLVEPIDGFSDSPYRKAGGEVVWLGTRPRVLHPRMVVITEPPASGVAFEVDMPVDLHPWAPAPQPAIDVPRFRRRVEALAESAAAVESPRGFGAVLIGRTPAFPLDLGVARVQTLESALDAGDVASIEAAATKLLGFGTGLTPSGDDLVGGLLFARRLVASDPAWRAMSERVIAAAGERTHTISAALFADLARGSSYAWLHDLVAALASDTPLAEVIATARTLVSVGHSSGWDMLTGFVLGATGCLSFSPAVSS